MCGDIYGRPTHRFYRQDTRILSAGVLLIDLITEKVPTVIIVRGDGVVSEPGGKFDPSKDKNPMMTAMREMKEETGRYVVVTGRDAYVDYPDIHGNGYRCYILVHRPKYTKYMSSFQVSGDSNHERIPLSQLLEERWKFRLAALMRSVIRFPASKKATRPRTLEPYLRNLNKKA